MPNWDDDSPRSRANFHKILEVIHSAAKQREIPAVEASKRWHKIIMSGLSVPDRRFVGAFRGQPGLEYLQVRVGSRAGVSSRRVAEELSAFEKTIQAIIPDFDELLPVGAEPDEDQLGAIIDVCAWAHSEWVRIHPFANGNGRIARVWADCIAVRYSLPAFVRFRPRPGSGYVEAGVSAMRGDWKPTALVFRRLLDDFLGR